MPTSNSPVTKRTLEGTSSKKHRKEMPKWVKGVLIGAAVVGVLLFVVTLTIGNLIRTKLKESGVSMQMDKNGKSISIKSDKNGEMQIGENVSIPAGFPKSVPVYYSAKPVSVFTADDGTTVSYSIENATEEAITKWYTDELKKNGWTIKNEQNGRYMVIKNNEYDGLIAIVSQDKATIVTVNLKKVK